MASASPLLEPLLGTEMWNGGRKGNCPGGSGRCVSRGEQCVRCRQCIEMLNVKRDVRFDIQGCTVGLGPLLSCSSWAWWCCGTPEEVLM